MATDLVDPHVEDTHPVEQHAEDTALSQRQVVLDRINRISEKLKTFETILQSHGLIQTSSQSPSGTSSHDFETCIAHLRDVIEEYPLAALDGPVQTRDIRQSVLGRIKTIGEKLEKLDTVLKSHPLLRDDGIQQPFPNTSPREFLFYIKHLNDVVEEYPLGELDVAFAQSDAAAKEQTQLASVLEHLNNHKNQIGEDLEGLEAARNRMKALETATATIKVSTQAIANTPGVAQPTAMSLLTSLDSWVKFGHFEDRANTLQAEAALVGLENVLKSTGLGSMISLQKDSFFKDYRVLKNYFKENGDGWAQAVASIDLLWHCWEAITYSIENRDTAGAAPLTRPSLPDRSKMPPPQWSTAWPSGAKRPNTTPDHTEAVQRSQHPPGMAVLEEDVDKHSAAGPTDQPVSQGRLDSPFRSPMEGVQKQNIGEIPDTPEHAQPPVDDAYSAIHTSIPPQNQAKTPRSHAPTLKGVQSMMQKTRRKVSSSPRDLLNTINNLFKDRPQGNVEATITSPANTLHLRFDQHEIDVANKFEYNHWVGTFENSELIQTLFEVPEEWGETYCKRLKECLELLFAEHILRDTEKLGKLFALIDNIANTGLGICVMAAAAAVAVEAAVASEDEENAEVQAKWFNEERLCFSVSLAEGVQMFSGHSTTEDESQMRHTFSREKAVTGSGHRWKVRERQVICVGCSAFEVVDERLSNRSEIDIAANSLPVKKGRFIKKTNETPFWQWIESLNNQAIWDLFTFAEYWEPRDIRRFQIELQTRFFTEKQSRGNVMMAFEAIAASNRGPNGKGCVLPMLQKFKTVPEEMSTRGDCGFHSGQLKRGQTSFCVWVEYVEGVTTAEDLKEVEHHFNATMTKEGRRYKVHARPRGPRTRVAEEPSKNRLTSAASTLLNFIPGGSN